MAESEISSQHGRDQAVAWFLSSEKTIAEIAATLNISESVVRQWVWNASPEDVADTARPEGEVPARSEADAAMAETAAANAAAVEAVLRAEVMAAEAVARAEAVAAEAKAAAVDAQAQLEAARAELAAAQAEIARLVAAEAAARQEISALYAEAVDAITRVEAAADEKIARAKAATDEAVTQARAVGPDAQAVAAGALAEALAAAVEALAPTQAGHTDPHVSSEVPSADAPAARAGVSARPRAQNRADDEAEARAKIAEVMARAQPVELWVYATGRTVEAARAEVLDRLDVDEARAEIEVLAEGSRWLPGRVQVRGRVRLEQNSGA